MTDLTYVIPTLNSIRTLGMTLTSLASEDVRVCVVDSGSTDGTLELCRRWGVRVLHFPPGNMYKAINHGLRSVEPTEWVAYINSDDWLYTGSVQRLLNAAPDADFVYGDCDFVDAQGRLAYARRAPRPDMLIPLFRLGLMLFAQPATIFRRAAYEQLQGFDERMSLCADADFFARALMTGLRFAHVPSPSVAAFRVHSGQLSAMRAAEMREETRALSSKVGSARRTDRLVFLRWKATNIDQYLLQWLRKPRCIS